MKKYTTLVILTLFLFSCENLFLDNDFESGDYFYLENDNAIMPVWVNGNINSNVFVIFLHGGPGNTSATYAISDAYQTLQQDYAFVYYDQRGSGAAQGNASPESFTVNQFVEDLEKIIVLINHKYENPVIFLVGKSWGGCVGTAFLLKPENQGKIKGWIEIDGAHNLKDGIPMSWEWAKNKANEQIALGNDTDYWQGEIDWYNSKPGNINTKYFLRHGKNLNTLNGIYLNPKNDPGNSISWSSPIPALYQLNALNINNHNNFDIKNIDFTSEMNKIKVPTMIMWGKHDGTLPVELAQGAYDSIGTDINDKFLHIFENSAHVPSFEETKLFVERMKSFIDKYK
jgi:pimeloyl-ACP methyl ester carboxylesterase